MVRPRGSYSAVESAFLPEGQRLVAAALAPAVRLLARLGVRPEAVSLAHLALGAATALTARRRPRLTLAMIGAAVLLDGLDGALARATSSASGRGACVDQVCDHLREALVAAAVARAGGLRPLWPALYALLYPLSNLALLAANRAGRPVPLAVKPVFTLYPAVAVFLWRGQRRWLEPAYALTLLALLVTLAQAGVQAAARGAPGQRRAGGAEARHSNRRGLPAGAYLVTSVS